MPIMRSRSHWRMIRLAGTFSFSLSILSMTEGRAAETPSTDKPTPQKPVAETDPSIKSKDLWVGHFSQCSYNALASVLTYFYGKSDSISDIKQFEKTAFVDPLESTGHGIYFGWGPWTSYMVNSGKVVWNGQTVTGLKAERFSLRTVRQPEIKGRLILVHYATGERETLRAKLLQELRRGPVVMWTPYGAVMDKYFSKPWEHVSRIEDQTDAVEFNRGLTHSVTLYLQPGEENNPDIAAKRVLVSDCSALNGLFVTDLDTIVSTSSAMTTCARLFIRQNPDHESDTLGNLDGVKKDEFNVVFFRST
jgi:hypothetical protein